MIEGDSIEYELIEKVCKLIKKEDPFTCEVGVRLGKGTKTILDTLKNKKDHWHIGIDPYGDITYDHFDKDSTVTHKSGTSPTYPNSMKSQLLQNIMYDNFTLFTMTDEDFFRRYGEGVPIFKETRKLKNEYDLVFLDGPHKTIDVIKEIIFFGERLVKEGFLILDDFESYKSPLCVQVAGLMNIKPMHVGENKIILRKY